MNEHGIYMVHKAFMIKDRGVIVVGKVSNGNFHVGEKIIIRRQNGTHVKSMIKSFEFVNGEFMKKEGTIAMSFHDVQMDDVSAGDVIYTEDIKSK